MCQEHGEKKEAEVPPSQPHESPESEPPKKKKRTKESFPPPDRLPSSEYYSESDDSDDQGENGNEIGKQVTLHEEMHEELYGSTPTKSVRAGSGDVALTELENTPSGQTIDDSDDDEAVGQSTAGPSQSTTGAHKDQPQWSFWLVPHCCFLSWLFFWSLICTSCQSLWLGVDIILGPPRQDTRPLTTEIAKLPDSSLQAQVFTQIHRMKSTNDLHADGLVQARSRWLSIHGGFLHVVPQFNWFQFLDATCPIEKETILPVKSLISSQAQRQMKKAAKAKGDPQDEQDEDSDAKYKDEAYDDGMTKGNRRGRGRGRGRGKGKSRGKGRGRPIETTEASNEAKAEEKEYQLSGDDDKPTADHASPKCSKESGNEKSDSDREDKKPVRVSALQEAVCGTPEKKPRKKKGKEAKTGKHTPLKGRSPKQIKNAVAATKKPIPQDWNS